MEAWEKEYLDIVKSKKQLSELAQSNGNQKEHIDAAWDEIVRPDGSKWYVPKQEKISFRCRWQRVIASVIRLFRKIIRFFVLLFCFLLIAALLLKLSISINTKNLNQNTVSAPTSSTSVSSARTYIDGTGLINMITTLSEIRLRQTGNLNEFISSGYAFSDADIDNWLVSIGADLHTITELTYDDSYSDVVEAHISMLDVLREYISFARSGNTQKVSDLHIELSNLLSSVNTIYAAAFDKNGVMYEIQEDGTLSISYYNY